MLSQDDRRQLAEMERRLRAEDPEFCARMSGRSHRRRTPVALIVVCVLVWAAVFGSAVAGWWPATSVFAAMAVASTGALGWSARRRDQG